MKKIYDTILFDVDGTLTDSSEGITKSVQYALKHFDIDEPDLSRLECFIGPPLVWSFQEYYGFSEEKARKARAVFQERYNPIGWQENYPYEGITQVLKELKAAGRTLAIATSKPEDVAEKVLKKFELWDYFDAFSASSLDGKHNDKAEMIEIALKKLKSAGHTITHPIMVGDREHDSIGAHACQIPCVGVAWGFAKKGEFEACDTEYVVETPRELAKLLLQKND